MINSDFLNAYDNKKDSIAAMLAFLAEKGLGKKGIQYKMKDWAFNRQRYWGEPIPLIHCPKCGTVGVPYEELPLRLPDVENFEPGTDGQSPLARIESFVNCTCPNCGGKAKRETDTMPQWAGSSWYYLRFIDPHNDECFCDPEKMRYWMPVDWYNGGMEHVTRHLLYSRFWHHFLYDIGEVNTPEPYAKRTYQGLILGPDGDKMSKSKGNVVDPINVIDRLGADALRLYVMFMGDYMAATPWSEESANGCKRFLDRVWRLQDMVKGEGDTDAELRTKVHACIKKVGEDYERMKFNTAIAAMMSLVNDFYAKGSLTRDEFRTLLLLLNPVAPHITEELNEKLGFAPLHHSKWPEFDPAALVEDSVEYGVQVNGKVRARIKLKKGMEQAAIVEAALALDEVKPFVEGKTIRKTIVVKNIINLVVG
jgi:leucyl-tRNA synthetase